ncbi:MAG TPA: SCP2 sterol-binding domain-containing protein [Steroidobacteraceae bacterium]|nr:SCP2 sterol-binding domain-containing protein [Steroidobacteraceae bacterium]
MLTATLENVLNRGLPRSPRAQQLCAELSGRSVTVEVREITRLRVESNGSTLRVTRAATDADAEIVGGPFSLLALGGATPEAVLSRGDVQIRGDTELAQKFRELVLLLKPDLEEELSSVVSDVPAHQIGRFARSAFGWTRRAVRTTVQNVAEYLAHERRDLVSRNEADPFLRGVDALREDVDRLEARLELLSRQRGLQ